MQKQLANQKEYKMIGNYYDIDFYGKPILSGVRRVPVTGEAVWGLHWETRYRQEN